MEPGSLVLGDGTVLPVEPGEPRLRALYTHDADSARLSLIQARNGAAVGPDGSSRSLNGPEDLRILRVTRSLADVVVVGAETARAERYGDIHLRADLLEARGEVPVHLAVVTASGRLPAGLSVDRTWVITTAAAADEVRSRAGNYRVVIAGESTIAGETLLEALRAQGLSRVLCEGGPHIANTLMGSGVVADYCLTTSPHPAGNGPLVPAVPESAVLTHTLEGGGFTMRRWTLA